VYLVKPIPVSATDGVGKAEPSPVCQSVESYAT
jgi:hypothetical protein